MKKYIITEELIKALLAYLHERPYKEVAAGIISLSKLEEIKDEDHVD